MRALIVAEGPSGPELRRLLESGGQVRVVAAAPDGPGALAQIRRTRPDVVLVDADATAFDGIETTRRIVRDTGHARTRVLLSGAFADQRRIAEALRAGAGGCVARTAGAPELISAARSVALGHIVIAAGAGRPVAAALADRGRLGADQRPAALARLTRREREVFELLAAGQGTRQIAETLVVGENTVRSHIKHIYTKLRLHGQVELVIFAHGHGTPGAAAA